MRNSNMAATQFDVSDIEDAIADEQIFLDYQPKIDLMTGDLVGVEALARWRRPM